MKLFLASENAGKIRELKELLARALPDIHVMSLVDLTAEERDKYRAEETGKTYAENALIKARGLSQALGADRQDGFILSDDSGFEVEFLGGEPGVYSARFAANDAERCEKILRAVHGQPVERRRARFVACLVLLEPGVNPVCFFGRKDGFISESARGRAGFGYDPIFSPLAGGKTWGELSAEEKNADSHRSRALDLVIQYLVRVVKD